MIEKTVEYMYEPSDRNRFLEVTYASGDKEILYFKDFNSGAMVENIVRGRRRKPSSGSCPPVRRASRARTSWSRSATSSRRTRTSRTPRTRTTGRASPARKGERIVYVRTLLGDDGDGRQVERVNAGQYL
jgi:proteasome-associated ATPase